VVFGHTGKNSTSHSWSMSMWSHRRRLLWCWRQRYSVRFQMRKRWFLFSIRLKAFKNICYYDVFCLIHLQLGFNIFNFSFFHSNFWYSLVSYSNYFLPVRLMRVYFYSIKSTFCCIQTTKKSPMNSIFYSSIHWNHKTRNFQKLNG